MSGCGGGHLGKLPLTERIAVMNLLRQSLDQAGRELVQLGQEGAPMAGLVKVCPDGRFLIGTEGVRPLIEALAREGFPVSAEQQAQMLAPRSSGYWLVVYAPCCIALFEVTSEIPSA